MVSDAESAQCVSRYWRDLQGFFLRRGVGHTDCEDLILECFGVLWRRREHVDPAVVRSFLFGTARNILAEHRRKHTRRMSTLQAFAAENEAVAPGPEGAAVQSETSQKLRELFARLAPRQREVIQLVHLEGVSFVEAGRRLGISEDTVRTHYHRAIKNLRVHALQAFGTGGSGASATEDTSNP